MLLTITNTTPAATDLGFLLHKNPARLHTRDLPFGRAHVFYPKAGNDECTAALMLEIDPVGLVRGRSSQNGEGGPLDQYVNDRPYVASSFMSVAIGRMFATAMSGRCKDRPELVDTPLALRVSLPVVACRGGKPFLKKLFEPLGYSIETEQLELDTAFPEWGASPYHSVTLAGTCTVHDLLSHLYVLIPVLDDEKHYYVGADEIEKLLRHGDGWLQGHPERDEIAHRYLKHHRRLTRMALARLVEEEAADPDVEVAVQDVEEAETERSLSLNEQRLSAVLHQLKTSGAKRVLDLGCGEGRLLKLLLKDIQFSSITGMDVSVRALETASERLGLSRLPERQRQRLTLIHGSLMYSDSRLKSHDAAAVVEVIEHLESYRLAAFERVLFEFAQPARIVLTTPNVEYNILFETLPAGRLRHRDHRFEWTRAEFRAWGDRIGAQFGYSVEYFPVGPEDPIHGAPTQMAVFSQ
ncbi:MAG: 3' terminal RNA ribose 2'-O-methyltransferase Hen1 [Candidatus Hydrogenedentes bacterium]|nr:3' terminal RNA ribose 2'-O-methyltransferase Hen1 [Candidatus Hydrogenedentota bacterium]